MENPSFSIKDFCLKCKAQYKKDQYLKTLSPEEREERKKELERKQAFNLLILLFVVITFFIPVLFSLTGISQVDRFVWLMILIPLDFIILLGIGYYRPRPERISLIEGLEMKTRMKTDIGNVMINKDEISNFDLLMRIEKLENEINSLKKIINEKTK